MTCSWAGVIRRLARPAAMGRGVPLVAAAATAALWCAQLAGAPPASAAGLHAAATVSNWGKAEEVPGTAALNKGGDADVNSVSCARVGSCGAGGFYTDGHGHVEAFVVNEKQGRWRNALAAPGLAALNAGGNAQVTSLSCPSAGDCVAGGFYTDGHGHVQAFVASERNGGWLRAVQVPGTAALNAGGHAVVNSVSCYAAGSCGAGGSYVDGSGATQAFVVTEKNGHWYTAVEVPGLAAMNAAGDAVVNSVSCSRGGNCGAGGSYASGVDTFLGQNIIEAFVVSEKNGIWRAALQVPGTAAANTGEDAQVSSVSCPSAGNCGAVGYFTYEDNGAPQYPQKFVVSEHNGRWGTAEDPVGVGGFFDETVAVSCASARNCSAGGYYYNDAGDWVALVVAEKNGVWGTTQMVRGAAAWDGDGTTTVASISCPSAGNCGAGGDWGYQSFVTIENNGSWGRARQIPGLIALGWAAGVNSVSCPPGGNCSAGGYYIDRRSRHSEAFVSSENK